MTKLVTIAALALSLTPWASAKPKFKVLAGFPNGGLWSGLTLDAGGNLYGVTTGGGDHGVGSVFQMTRNSVNGQWTVNTLHSFNGKDGSEPNGDLIFDAAGNLYGTTPTGGYFDSGTVFELSPGSAGWSLTTLYDLCHDYGCPDGGGPSAGLAMDKDGNLLGTAGGGLYGMGVVFELTPGAQGWTYRVLYDFGTRSQDGSNPIGVPVLDAKGNIYGSTYFGGSYNFGTVFKLKPSCNGLCEWPLLQFNSSDGAGPEGSLVFDKEGRLYGTTNGSTNNIFKLTFKSGHGWKEAVLYEFLNTNNGFAPIAGPILGTGGTLYGTTALGGTGSCNDGCGVVYQLSPHAGRKWEYTVLHKFNGADGFVPNGRLVRDAKGNLYGTAFVTVFEVTP